MGGRPDLTAKLFTATALNNSAFAYSNAVQVRQFSQGEDLIEVLMVSLLGSVVFGTATSITFVVEQSLDGSTNWTPIGILGAPTLASGVGTSELVALQFTRTVTGAMPTFSFTPDAPYFRVGAKSTSNDSTATMTAYCHQTGAVS